MPKFVSATPVNISPDRDQNVILLDEDGNVWELYWSLGAAKIKKLEINGENPNHPDTIYEDYVMGYTISDGNQVNQFVRNRPMKGGSLLPGWYNYALVPAHLVKTYD